MAFYGASQWRLQDPPKSVSPSAVSPVGQMYQAQQSQTASRYGAQQPTSVQSANKVVEARVQQGQVSAQRVAPKSEQHVAKLQAQQAYLTKALKLEQEVANAGLLWAAVFSKNARELLRMMAKRTQKQVDSKQAAIVSSQKETPTAQQKLDHWG
jgi:hypothetical protein